MHIHALIDLIFLLLLLLFRNMVFHNSTLLWSDDFASRQVSYAFILRWTTAKKRNGVCRLTHLSEGRNQDGFREWELDFVVNQREWCGMVFSMDKKLLFQFKSILKFTKMFKSSSNEHSIEHSLEENWKIRGNSLTTAETFARNKLWLIYCIIKQQHLWRSASLPSLL